MKKGIFLLSLSFISLGFSFFANNLLIWTILFLFSVFTFLAGDNLRKHSKKGFNPNNKQP